MGPAVRSTPPKCPRGCGRLKPGALHCVHCGAAPNPHFAALSIRKDAALAEVDSHAAAFAGGPVSIVTKSADGQTLRMSRVALLNMLRTEPDPNTREALWAILLGGEQG